MFTFHYVLGPNIIFSSSSGTEEHILKRYIYTLIKVLIQREMKIKSIFTLELTASVV
jgi:hypothetical protein